MKFLLSHVRLIMAQLELLVLLVAPARVPAFVAPVAQVIGRLRPSWNAKNLNDTEFDNVHVQQESEMNCVIFEYMDYLLRAE